MSLTIQEVSGSVAHLVAFGEEREEDFFSDDGGIASENRKAIGREKTKRFTEFEGVDGRCLIQCI